MIRGEIQIRYTVDPMYVGACSQVATGGAQGEVRRLQPTDEEVHPRPRHNRLPEIRQLEISSSFY